MTPRCPSSRVFGTLAALFFTALLAACSGTAAEVAGDWSGPLVLAGDQPAGTLHVTLIDVSDEMEGYTGPNLEGTARFCLGGETGTFDLYGEVNGDGDILSMHFRAVEDDIIWRYFPTGGQWNGETVTITGPYNYDPTAAFIISSEDPVTTVTVTLARTESAASAVDCP
jgi:hypothetical protein